jgi:thiol-disulfide isomerase/thioredoxin
VLLCAGADCAKAAPRQLPPRDAGAEAALKAYAAAGPPKAFAMAPGSAWGWVADQPNQDAALRGAMASCQTRTELHCVPLMDGAKWVFNAREWPQQWRPYVTDELAKKAPVGAARGQRLPDLAFTTPTGQASSLSQWRGKVVVVYIWGSWCEPCRKEMPEIQKLTSQLAGRKDIAFLLLQAREPIQLSRQWLREHGIRLPLHDSGAEAQQNTLKLSSGARIADSVLAPVFPSTYVLDQNGLVVFSHKGELAGWPSYAPLLRDLAGGANH